VTLNAFCWPSKQQNKRTSYHRRVQYAIRSITEDSEISDYIDGACGVREGDLKRLKTPSMT
jgi:hypothetical protein